MKTVREDFELMTTARTGWLLGLVWAGSTISTCLVSLLIALIKSNLEPDPAVGQITIDQLASVGTELNDSFEGIAGIVISILLGWWVFMVSDRLEDPREVEAVNMRLTAFASALFFLVVTIYTTLLAATLNGCLPITRCVLVTSELIILGCFLFGIASKQIFTYKRQEDEALDLLNQSRRRLENISKAPELKGLSLKNSLWSVSLFSALGAMLVGLSAQSFAQFSAWFFILSWVQLGFGLAHHCSLTQPRFVSRGVMIGSAFLPLYFAWLIVSVPLRAPGLVRVEAASLLVIVAAVNVIAAGMPKLTWCTFRGAAFWFERWQAEAQQRRLTNSLERLQQRREGPFADCEEHTRAAGSQVEGASKGDCEELDDQDENAADLAQYRLAREVDDGTRVSLQDLRDS